MFFIPYRAQIKQSRVPWTTLGVTLVCLLIYWAQSANEQAIQEYAETFCTAEVAEEVEYVQRQYIGSGWKCGVVLSHIYFASYGDKGKHLGYHLRAIQEQGDEQDLAQFKTHYTNFASSAPRFKTAGLWLARGNWDPIKMVISSLSHGSWWHVLGNLFFFIAFGMVVENVLGPGRYLLVVLGLAVGIGVIDNLVHFDMEVPPTLGLSGVVMGSVALCAWFAPWVRIHFFYFVLIFPGVMTIPAWFLAVWYIGWDALNNLSGANWGVNYIAHLAGAAIALTLALTLFRDRRTWAQENLIIDEWNPSNEESWLTKFRVITSLPVVLYMLTMAGVMVIIFFAFILKNYTVPLLFISPALLAIYLYRRNEKAGRSEWQRFQDGMAHYREDRFKNALDIFIPLAENGYGRAQHQLAQLYLLKHNTARNELLAMKWLEQAANRGMVEAQYDLAMRYMDGRGMVRNVDKAMDWLDKALHKGLAQAAMSLGYLYEQHPDKDKRDLAKAAEIYRKAADLFQKKGQAEDAEMARRCLNAIKLN